MKILITGFNGMLGTDLVPELMNDHEVAGLSNISTGKPSCTESFVADLTIFTEIQTVFEQFSPELVIHAAAYTNVDGCEANVELAKAINVQGTKNIIDLCKARKVRLIFISTDYVFDGKKDQPYKEDDPIRPISSYGSTKAIAERFVLEADPNNIVIRTSWLYGEYGKNFFSAILRKFESGETLRVVNDQIGAPTSTRDLASGLRTIVSFLGQNALKAPHNIYHLTNSGKISWHGVAIKLAELCCIDREIQGVSSADLDLPAKRPLNSELSNARVCDDFGIQLQSWEDALVDSWNVFLNTDWSSYVEKTATDQ